jgi:hypothetical protein
MKMMVHINKFELKKGKRGRPWTIHTSKGCIPAKEVQIEGHSEAQCFPERKTNPKCFIVVNGELKRIGKDRFLLTAAGTPASLNGIRGRLDPKSRRADWFST